MDNTLVSIVIPARNSARTLALTIEACLKQTYQYKEIIIVDDGSSDSTFDIAQKYPCKVLRTAGLGPAYARNLGWKNSKGDIICFTDSDCIPDKYWLEKLLANYKSADIAGVGGTYNIANKESLLVNLIHEEIIQRHFTMPLYVDYLGSFNVSYRKNVLEEVGGFNESYKTASGEDNDLSYRIRKKGYKLVFAKEAIVAHHHPENLWKYLRVQFRHGF